MKKIAFFMTLALFASSFAANRVGPVSQYGQLQAGKDSNGKGRIFGSCSAYNSTPVQVKGMSLYWSLMKNAVEFWTAEGVSSMVSDMKIEIVRGAMATGNEDWSDGIKGYASEPDKQKGFMNAVVQGAIDNDIYVIIDWHSHCAEQSTNSAVQFFTEMAQKWGKYDNVIFEIYNEPKNSCGEKWPDEDAAKSYWKSGIAPYAKTVIQAIRQYSDNLVLVGTPYYDQYTNAATAEPLQDQNVAYTFHYYAGSHKTGSEGANAVAAINAGLSVFVSEWGTGTADGKGDPNNYVSQNNSWQQWMDSYKLSWANWSASKISEGTAAFSSGATRYSLSYSTSGNMVKGFLANNPKTYTACGGSPAAASSSSAAGRSSSSNGTARSSSSAFVPNSSNSYAPGWDDNTAIYGMNVLSHAVTLEGRTLQVVGEGYVSVNLFDMQGRLMARFGQVSGTVNLEKMAPGRYILQVRSGLAQKSHQIVLK